MSSFIERTLSESNEDLDDENVPDNAIEQDEKTSIDKKGLLGEYITKEYELLRLVLSHLTFRDLHSAAQVCRTWASAADVIRRTHTKPHWLMWIHSRNGPRSWELPQKLFAEHFYCEPQLCLFFMTECVFGSIVDCMKEKVPCPITSKEKSCSLMSHRVIDYIRAEVQPICPCVVVKGSGVVGTLHDMTKTQEIEEGKEAYSGVLLPRVPGLTVTYFQLDDKLLSTLSKGCLDSEQLTKLGIPSSSTPIRCLLLFCRKMNTKAIRHLVMSLQNRQEEGIAVGGGCYDSISLGNVPFSSTLKRHMAVFGIVLSGENILAASTILGANIIEKRNVDEAMAKLKSCNLSSKDSVAFMFACAGRGKHWYNQTRNVESESFRRHFPSTPLVGYFGNGEVGLSFMPGLQPKSSSTSDEPPKKVARPPLLKVVHSYTTVFVYLALGGQAPS